MVNTKSILVATLATAIAAQDPLAGILSEIGQDIGGIATAGVGEAKSWIQVGESYAGDGIKTAWNGAQTAWNEAQSAIQVAESKGGQVRSEARDKANGFLSDGRDAMATAVAEASKLKGDAKSVAPSVSAKIHSVIQEGEDKAASANAHAASVLKAGIETSGASVKKTDSKATNSAASVTSSSSSSGSGSSSGSATSSASQSSSSGGANGMTVASCGLSFALLSFLAAAV